jgi:hypothetical protein
VTAAGYSGTPLARKLGFKPSMRAHFAGAPEGFSTLLGELPLVRAEARHAPRAAVDHDELRGASGVPGSSSRSVSEGGALGGNPASR